ncbi:MULTISPECIES: porin [Massilia]|uniref:Porin n=2 Tax=Massilia TaxID=149698 RepID=A0ABX0MV32_9BURK|nr:MULTISPECIES: porin [Massilia]NHZ66585.1 porin [Massilia genomosp. 1]NHZ93030.1 porin [Massilia mucilaginosa]
MQRRSQLARVCCTAPLRLLILMIPLNAYAADVVMYGYLDLGVVKETGTSTRLDRGFFNYLGVRGEEDLGAKSSATFNLQMRFSPDTGMQERSTTLFQGESTVGLKNAALGHLRLGRAMTPLWQEKWRYDPWYDSASMGSLEVYNGDFNSDGLPTVDYHNYSRVGNGVFYTSPSVGGIRFNGMAEAQLAAGATARSRGMAVNFGEETLTAMISYEKNHLSDNILYAAGSYRMDQFTMIGAYSRTDFSGGGASQRSMLLAGTYAINLNLLRFGYGRLNGSLGRKTSVGYIYGLSKRTNIYSDVYREKISSSKTGLAIGFTHSL